jgi:SAM-dependent methyltransferase
MDTIQTDTPISQRSNNSHLTAIKRTKLSAPMRFLKEEGYLQGSHLDYGCGKGSDANILNIERYDPYWFNVPLVDTYDTITCLYVLNVIPDLSERATVLHELHRLLKPDGVAYIAVRRDRFTEGWTSRGTWQGHVVLNLETVHIANGRFQIYKLTKDSKDVL